MENRTYEVEVKKSTGSCDTSIFKKMAVNGDITSIKIEEAINSIVSITGIAECHVKTNDKEFDINYFATKELGFISTGSNIFLESVLDYLGEVEFIKIQKIKTKNGITYKAVPILSEDELVV